MSMFLGQRAYEAYRAKAHEVNVRTLEWWEFPFSQQEAWQAAAEAVARQCGVDPAVFDQKQPEQPNEGG
jgi:hypothetical protein